MLRENSKEQKLNFTVSLNCENRKIINFQWKTKNWTIKNQNDKHKLKRKWQKNNTKWIRNQEKNTKTIKKTQQNWKKTQWKQKKTRETKLTKWFLWQLPPTLTGVHCQMNVSKTKMHENDINKA